MLSILIPFYQISSQKLVYFNKNKYYLTLDGNKIKINKKHGTVCSNSKS